MIEEIESRGHKFTLTSETCHKIFIGEGIGQIAPSAACGFELSRDFGELFREENFVATSCGSDSGNHPCGTGTDDDQIIRRFGEMRVLHVPL